MRLPPSDKNRNVPAGPQDPGGHRRTKRRGKLEPAPKKKMTHTNMNQGFWGGSGFKWDAWMNGNSPRHGLEEMDQREQEKKRRAKEFGGPGF